MRLAIDAVHVLLMQDNLEVVIIDLIWIKALIMFEVA